MVETQDELKIGIGDEEVIMLKPANVKILNVRVEEVGKITKAKKVICEVKHPDSEIPINISGVKCENKGKLEVIGLWVNKDSKGFIRKGSTLALFLNFLGANSIGDLRDKSILTIHDDNGYLVFKGY